jgi:uncharacterized membrane protein YheB (UPF0754 family)
MQLTPEQVNEFISKAILESQIGEAVKASVERVMADLKKSYQNPFDDVIKRHVNQAIEQLIVAEYAPVISERVKSALAEQMTDDMVGKIISHAVEKMQRGY